MHRLEEATGTACLDSCPLPRVAPAVLLGLTSCLSLQPECAGRLGEEWEPMMAELRLVRIMLLLLLLLL